jgi:cysteine desulfurase/selenocysteine lyase
VSVISFNLERKSPYDIGVLLDDFGIAVRTGHHCCQPLMNSFGISGTIRASFAIYNTKGEIDELVSSLEKFLRRKK